MELSEFDNHYLTNLLDNLSAENKTVLLGDINADLLNQILMILILMQI